MDANLSHPAREVYRHDRDRFLRCLFIAPASREAFFCLYALNLELARIPQMVSEEMIGHIRYAWWYEAIEKGETKGQPLLEAMKQAQFPRDIALKLAGTYRDAYPEGTVDPDAAALEYMGVICPQTVGAWQRAGRVIGRHRRRHGGGGKGWLGFKLLISGLY